MAWMIWQSCEQTRKLRSHFCHFSRLTRQLQSACLRKKHAGLQVGSGQEQQGNRIGVASRMWHGSAESAHEGILGFHHFLLPSLLGLVCPGTFGARGGHQHGHVWESTLSTRRQPQAGGLPEVQVTQDRQSVLPVRRFWFFCFSYEMISLHFWNLPLKSQATTLLRNMLPRHGEAIHGSTLWNLPKLRGWRIHSSFPTRPPWRCGMWRSERSNWCLLIVKHAWIARPFWPVRSHKIL